MNALTPIVAATPPSHLDAACVRLNQWRGQMVENFARSEQAVTETLALLNDTAPQGRGVKLPHLVGQRYGRLIALLSSDATPSGHTKVSLAALQKFREHDALRTMLCHGVTKAAVDRGGEWVALMTLTSFKANAVTIDRMTLLEAEGGALLGQVVDYRRRVCAALGQVRREARVPK
ncbi:hypothetical protein [Sphingomonas japonica]|uniref:Uncharacterized protein n=1 Tax=Sphingomonas japonica TaxID=511662 RepID=A0ABX0U3F5_9SPHN|nr:hypothetical protein [Sphingomonas japonica]NIJ24216.1 hypothetical protein [Sphingomonas japonica]